MKPKVFIGKPIPEEVEKYIAEHCEYTIWREEEPIPYQRLLKEVKDAEGLMGPKVQITEDFLQHASKLRIVSNVAAGYENFETELMEEYNVLGTHTPYVLDETVADLLFGLLISASRRIAELDRYVKQGKWTQIDDPFFYGKDVHHSKLGIIGLGRIGEKIARRAKFGFEMDVIYYNRTKRQDLEEKYGVEQASLDELLASSDFVLVMVPLSDKTYHMIGETEFNKMKKDAIFINGSRGKVINEKALIEALKQKEIRGAALDVYETEPVDTENPLLKMENVVTTPHMASATHQARFMMAMKAAENLVAGVTGHVPTDVVKELKHMTD